MVIRLRDPLTGRKLQFGLYEEGHVLRLTDLVPDGQQYTLLTLRPEAPSGNLCKLHKVESLAVLYRKIILAFLHKVIDSLIEDADHYQLPTSGGARWRVLAKPQSQTQSIAARDQYKFVDLRKSKGRIYELVMEYRAHGKSQKRILRIGYEQYRHLCALVETGRSYDIA